MRLRNMASIYVWDGDRVLMIERTGSRAFTGTLWCGIGGHFEPEEMNDPAACILREWQEETGFTADDVKHLALRYITTRVSRGEIRQQYIFFADWAGTDKALAPCNEGEIAWIHKSELFDRRMSFTNENALRHYLLTGSKDDRIYAGAAGEKDGQAHMVWTALEEFDLGY